ncbi:1801_t:CDS:2 [Rhizophagus irregularis]|nr:1801_t:CDS:2 [Rhizophagus irregularis]
MSELRNWVIICKRNMMRGPRGGVFTFGYFINQTGGLIFACAFVSGEEEHFGHSIGHDGYNLG